MESEEQYIRIKAIIEVLGKPKEYIEDKIREYINEIKQDENLMVVKESISEAKQQDKLWSIFADIELVIKGIGNLIGFCIDYMPSSIDIIKPEKFDFEQRAFNGFVNDLLAKLHTVDMIAKQLGTENKFLKKNMNNIIRNNIMVLTKFGVNNLENLSKATGIEDKEIKIFLDNLIKENRIKEGDGIYYIV